MKRIIIVLLALILLLSVFGWAQQDSSAASLQSFVAANNRFGLKYLRQLQRKNPKDNLLVPPASLSLAFALLQNGADANADKEIGEAFERTNFPVGQLNLASQQLLATLAESQTGDRNRDTTFRISNSLWMGRRSAFRPEIKQTAQRFYGAGVNALPGPPEKDQKMLDAFLAKSLGRPFSIPTPLLDRFDFALIMATVFDGKWASEFYEPSTTLKDFKLRDHTKRRVDMMQKYQEFSYLRGDHFQAVHLAYTEHYGMYVFLPDDDEGIDSLVQSITPEAWNSWTSSFEDRPGQLELPKFRIVMSRNSTADLVELGIVSPFRSPASMANLVTTPEGAILKEALEDASLDVNEKRTVVETRGMIGGVVGGISGGYLTKPPEPFHMLVDHPFLFAIGDGKTNSILYIGVVTSPPAGNKKPEQPTK